jgi:hypothetical protein
MHTSLTPPSTPKGRQRSSMRNLEMCWGKEACGSPRSNELNAPPAAIRSAP